MAGNGGVETNRPLAASSMTRYVIVDLVSIGVLTPLLAQGQMHPVCMFLAV